MRRRAVHIIALVCLLLGYAWSHARAEDKPVAAIFPLGGDAPESQRQRAADALRTRLDRTGVYRVIDGPKMLDLLAESGKDVTFQTPPETVSEIGRLVDADVLLWGDVIRADRAAVLRVKILDLRQNNAAPQAIEQRIVEPTDLRFATEAILESLPGVKPFTHPSEEPVQRDSQAEQLWQTNPNLVRNGDFAQPGQWEAIYQSQRYAVKISDSLPAIDAVNIYRLPEAGSQVNPVLAMRLSRQCAEGHGMACLSAPIPIEPNTRYRLSFRYRSDGPVLRVFVKGYMTARNSRGEPVEREVYRRQVPPAKATGDQWVEIVDELNPQHVTFPVEYLRVDLYAYLHPGTVMFDDVVLKAVGQPTRKAVDAALDPPTTLPARQR